MHYEGTPINIDVSVLPLILGGLAVLAVSAVLIVILLARRPASRGR
jgi:hypothetical protein